MQAVIANKALSLGRRAYKAGETILTNALFARKLKANGSVSDGVYERRDMQADLSFQRNEYETKFGRKADARWGLKRLTAELSKD